MKPSTADPSIVGRRKLEIEECIHEALENNEFYLVYQPIVDVYKKTIVGLEALLRWESKKLGMVSPLEFIPIAEQSDLIFSIGEWVFETACHHKRQLMNQSLPNIFITINVSMKQFQDENIVNMIEEKIASNNIPSQEVKIELTESTAMTEIDKTLEKMNEIKKLGIDIFLDDFGTGYSSLSHLEILPISTLKIDRSFILDINKRERKRYINEAIVSMAKSLRLSVIGEGVEEQNQYQYLCSIGCHIMQGYYFSRPISFDEAEKLLHNNKKKESSY